MNSDDFAARIKSFDAIPYRVLSFAPSDDRFVRFAETEPRCQLGESLFCVADRSAQGPYEIASSCNRSGACKECIVQV
ncbi:MAG: hypothetical protein QHJ82_14500, partial [Verrucomicrobiota bacterium]|nr:hypothetical protein [Verrucomicrobiota bacterium]